jgi:hypothetical protein
MRSPSAVTTDSSHRVFVADPGAQTVHIFDFVRSKYERLDRGGDRLHIPVSLALDGQDNLYVVTKPVEPYSSTIRQESSAVT